MMMWPHRPPYLATNRLKQTALAACKLGRAPKTTGLFLKAAR